jgi:hypothetical protein
MLVSRRECEESFRVQCYSVVDGSPVTFDGLAEAIRAALMKSEAGGMSETLPASERQRECGTGGTDCLAERMRRAEERVARARGQGTLH